MSEAEQRRDFKWKHYSLGEKFNYAHQTKNAQYVNNHYRAFYLCSTDI